MLVMVLSAVLPLHAQQLKIALQNKDGSDLKGKFPNVEKGNNLPIIAVKSRWPLNETSIAPLFPPVVIPVLLQVELDLKCKPLKDDDLNNFRQVLLKHGNILYLSIGARVETDELRYFKFLLKKIISIARGVRPGMNIAVDLSGKFFDKNSLEITGALISDITISPFFNALCIDTSSKNIRKIAVEKRPSIFFWEMIDIQDTNAFDDPKPMTILSILLDRFPAGNPNTTMLIIPSINPGPVYAPVSRFSEYFGESLFTTESDRTTIVRGNGSSYSIPMFYKSSDLYPVLFLKGKDGETVKVKPGKGKYQKAIITNLLTGNRRTSVIHKYPGFLNLNLEKAFFGIELIPVKPGKNEDRVEVDVSGEYRLTASEIMARVRAWREVQRSKLKSYTADMTVSMLFNFANFNEKLELKIKGPLYFEKGKSRDWVWKEFYINGVRWKGKKAPKIPLLQPEKVKVIPIDINLIEGYRYSLAGEASIKGRPVYIIDFKPGKEFKAESMYRGKLWIDKKTFTCLRQQSIQLNLKGNVLSNVETQYMKPVNKSSGIWLPLNVKGYQTFSISGRVTHIEIKTSLSKVVINPENLSHLKEKEMKSPFRILRDTDKGLKYLIKDKKTGKRKVDWEVDKSQVAAVIGSIYQSSFASLIPLAGINYMNFDVGGKNRQLNVLFGGVLLSALYSDPTFLGTKIDVGANILGFALPFKNTVYRNGSPLKDETIKMLPFRMYLNAGAPIGPYLKLSLFLFMRYFHFSRSNNTAGDFVLPQNSFDYGSRLRLAVNYKGFQLSLSGKIAARNRWEFWGLPGYNEYNPVQKSYVRWQAELSKDFFLSGLTKLHVKTSYLDGLRLDRFSAYKFGFFNEFKIHGFNSGLVRAHRAWMLSLSYGIDLGKAFSFRAWYDSAWLTNTFEGYNNTYFSGAAISGTTIVPLWGNMLLKFEIGRPIVGNGVKGFIAQIMFLKMF